MASEPRIISIIIPVYNSASMLERCLTAVAASDYPHYECIVVNDGSTDDSADVARRLGARVIDLPGGPCGPAAARNRGAEAANGDTLFFIDADVIVHPDTVRQVADTFARRPEIDAVFGSYDDNPEGMDFLSRYKNLFHHFVHQGSKDDAATFWSGCGAVRRPVFIEVGGFDEHRYRRPSIEDIDLGYRLRAAGHKITLNKQMLVQHLKRWTLRGMIKTDVFDRGIPWTELVLREKRLPNDLNLRLSQRISAVLLYVVMLYLGLIAFSHDILLLPLLAGLFLLMAGNWSEGTPHFQMSAKARALTYALMAVIAALAPSSGNLRIIPLLGLLLFGLLADRWLPHSNKWSRRIVFGGVVLGLAASVVLMLMSFSVRLGAPLLCLVFVIMAINHRFYTFFVRRQGLVFTLAVLPFHLLYYLYSIAAFVMGAGAYLREGRRTEGDTWSGGHQTLSPLGEGRVAHGAAAATSGRPPKL